jgi:hypothetical protein
MSIRSNNGKTYANALEKHKSHKAQQKKYAMSKVKSTRVKASGRSK